MLAAFYDRQGAAADVLHVGELPDPAPGAGEVRVRLTVSGVNPGDTKKRGGRLGNPMAFPRVVPHSDGAGVVDAVGAGVDPTRVGQRVWVHGAQSYRPFGTAAEFTAVPDAQAVRFPADVSDELGACLGILGGVGSMAAQLARWNGASVVGTVRRAEDVREVAPALCDEVVALDDPDPVSAVVSDGAVIAAYASRADRPSIPFWPLLFANVTLRMFGSDDFPSQARRLAVQDLVNTAAEGALTAAVAARYPLAEVARSHDHVDAGTHGRVLVTTA